MQSHELLREVLQKSSVKQVAADLGLNLAIVSVDGGPSSYWHPRSDGRDPMSMVFDELLPSLPPLPGSCPSPRSADGH